VLFGLSIYVFRYRFTPGRLYIIATFLFFMLATASIVLDLVLRCLLPVFLPGLETVDNSTQLALVLSLQSALDYIFLVTGLLGDVILIHRCYRLWYSRKHVVIIPLVGVLAILIVWIVNEVVKRGFEDSITIEQLKLSNQAIDGVFRIYIIVTFVQNVILTGMIAGRLWWLKYKMKKMLTSQSGQRTSPNLLGPILESGLLTPAFLLVWLVLNSDPEIAFTQCIALISPCVLTQIVGIASTLIIVRIGLGVDALSSTELYHTLAEDAENQHASSDLATGDHNEISESNENIIISLREPEFQPFQLKYDHPIEDFPSMTYHTLSAAGSSRVHKLVQPHLKGKYAKLNK